MDAAEVQLRRRFARRAVPLDAAKALAALGELVGLEGTVRSHALHLCGEGTLRAALLEPLAGVVLAPADGAPGHLAILELDPLLAAWIAERLLGGDGAEADGVSPLADVQRGAVAFAASRVAVAAESAWRVGGVVTTEAAFVAAIGDHGSAVWNVELSFPGAPGLGSAARSARLWLPIALLDGLSPSPPSGWLGQLPLTLAADGGEAELEAGVLGTLRAGDVLVPDRWWGSDGEVRVRPLGAKGSWWCSVSGAGGDLRLERLEPRREAESRRGRTMSDTADETKTDGTSDGLAAIGDAPVTLSLELARFELGLHELGALRPGEVVATGVPIGREVRLRVGTRVIATGELVDVDGEVGVRLIALG